MTRTNDRKRSYLISAYPQEYLIKRYHLSFVGEAEADHSIIVQLIGTNTGIEGTVPDIDGDGMDDPGLCFDVDLVDTLTARVIGTATDCLSNITPVGNEGGLAVIGTTFFNFPGGTLVSRGLTTVQPTTHGSPNFTHITGALPVEDENSILFGTGRFANADEGSVRLSGAVAMIQLGGGDLQITFDCIFVISLDH